MDHAVTITGVEVIDVRFPTSLTQDGSDAMNKDGDHSAAYVVIRTSDPTLMGQGLAFTIGRGTELVVSAAETIARQLVGRGVDAMASDMGAVYRDLSSDSQMRWLGPEKGVVHLALAAVLNASWDLVARRAGQPLWLLLSRMTSQELVAIADMRYLGDACTAEEAVELLQALEPSRQERIDRLLSVGYPCYTTSPGWLGYSDEKLAQLVNEALEAGFKHIKLKVGANIDDDLRRCGIVRELLGPDRHLMVDANQVWEVPQAIEWVKELSEFDIYWVEEPTSPDDVVGHAAIRRAVAPVRVATGEHAHNRVMFKQLLELGAIDVCQIDSCRLASINEIVAVLILAAKFNVPVCPHAGGVGLCETVQHLSMFDFIAVSGTMESRVAEYIDHLREHFVEPSTVVDGRYIAPVAPGYGTPLAPRSIETYRFPAGDYWAGIDASPTTALG